MMCSKKGKINECWQVKNCEKVHRNIFHITNFQFIDHFQNQFCSQNSNKFFKHQVD